MIPPSWREGRLCMSVHTQAAAAVPGCPTVRVTLQGEVCIYLPKIASHTCSGHMQVVPGAHSWSICLSLSLCSCPAVWHIPHLGEGLC